MCLICKIISPTGYKDLRVKFQHIIYLHILSKMLHLKLTITISMRSVLLKEPLGRKAMKREGKAAEFLKRGDYVIKVLVIL